MTISSIITDFGSYYIAGSANNARLVSILYQGDTTAQSLTRIITDDTQFRAASSTMTSLVQPFQKAWTPTGTPTFTPVKHNLFKMKVDIEETPDDLQATWLGFLASPDLDRKQWPFVRWLMEVHLLPKIQQDIELSAIWGGSYVAPTAGTASTPAASMDGLKKILEAHITAGTITPIVTGAIATAPKDFVAQCNDFVDAITTQYQAIPMEVCMSYALARKYIRGSRELYGKDTDFTGTNRLAIDGTPHVIVGLPSMGASSRIWMTPKENKVLLLKNPQNMQTFAIENVDRKLKLYSDWYMGVGVHIPQIVFTNDQA